MQNDDVIGTVTLPFSKEILPIVTSADKAEGYYDLRRYDGQFARYCTPYTPYAYDENNANPNLVVYGGKLFAPLFDLVDGSSSSKKHILTTDSILYGEDDWEIFSVIKTESVEGADYVSNFVDMTAEQRVAAVKKVLSLSKVDFGFAESDFENVGLSTNFLTLIGEHKGESVVVMARRVSEASFDVSEPVEDAPVQEESNGEGEGVITEETNNEEEE